VSNQGPMETLFRELSAKAGRPVDETEADIVGVLERALCPLTGAEIFLVLTCDRAKKLGIPFTEIVPDYSILIQSGLSDAAKEEIEG
jgi:hypothetical protein